MNINLQTSIDWCRIMKITCSQLLIAIVFTGVTLAGTDHAQSILSRQVDISAHNMDLGSFLKKLEKKANVKFIYFEDLLESSKKITLDARQQKLKDVLTELLQPYNINYDVVNDRIVLSRNTGTPAPTAAENAPVREEAQAVAITGKVTDEHGQALPGVVVKLKGTNIAVSTNEQGVYIINIPDNQGVLVFSFIGYTNREVPVNGQKVINIQLQQESKDLSEVVVVGYGTQKKVNLTGSVSSVSASQLEDRPITQASQALAGLAAGVQVSQNSGRPGNDGAGITIRGIGSFGAGRDALVLIDGLAGSLNDIDPDNIKSISILKDAASASIYGTRAANGVILVETKRGQNGKVQISYNNYVGWQKATSLPDFVDSWEYAQLTGATADVVAKYKSGTDPDNYPNVSHLKNLLNSGSGFQTDHNVSLAGGDQKSSYMLSLGYLNQNGIVAKNDYEKYNFLLNVDSKIKDNLTLKVNINGYSSNTKEPRQSSGDMQSMIGYAVREPNTFAGLKSDGTYGHQDSYSPEGWLASPSFNDTRNKYFMGGLELSWEIVKGLTLSGKGGYKYYDLTNTNYVADVQFDANTYIGPNSLTIYKGDGALTTLQSLLQYTKTIQKHTFTALAGYSQEANRDNWIQASRDNFPSNLLYELNAGAATNMQSSGSASEWALRSYFGRVNYDFAGKYLFEANARYDGSSRFPENNRWGFFPSVSAGWRVSEESFIKDNFNWIDNLKLRASWGELGNQNISNYPYQNAISLGQNYTFGGSLVSGAAVTTLSNINIKWETTKVTDIGLDLDVFKGKLSMTLDYFDKTTSDILYNVPVSSVLGLTPSEVNAGAMKNTGFEVMLKYNTAIGNFHIGASPNFSYVNSRVTKIAGNIQQDISAGLFVGQSLNPIYGYVADGIFKDAADVASYATQPIAGQPGVIRFKDISGPNGVPDGVVNSYDRTVIGNTTPKFAYGLTLTASYKGFDFTALLQGLGGYTKQMGSYQAFAYYNSGNIQRWQADNAWTTANPNPNALYPAITGLSQGSENVQTSTFWNRNATYLRLKNLQLGYSFSDKVVKRLHIGRLRVFAGGQNLFSWNHFYKGWDPEMYQATGDSPNFYPITSVYTFGANVKF
ncbi:TonB-dependent receptor plug [Mucilaginibacter paludis DSM 18603]|uniref:TonB-dependent receptor plug n=2 Tax=Mucilaginibacter TaxID=423349 RepID=H1Y8W2_9SPHI|nr:TonB-dependent receptor plug [Mucilaginibacter paludis DSM 18603]